MLAYILGTNIWSKLDQNLIKMGNMHAWMKANNKQGI